jgi:uncharacterized protein YeaO (DUF488 family)
MTARRKRAATRVPSARAAKPAARLSIKVKRAYDPPDKADGLRVLIDRLWPRGMTKTKAKIDLWPRDLAPSNELRRWYHAHRDRFDEFRHRYRVELSGELESIMELHAALRDRTVVTLVTATREVEHSHADVLRDILTDLRQP